MDVTTIPEKPQARQLEKEDVDERSSASDTVTGGRSSIHIDPVAEKRVIRKCDYRVVPPLTVLFLLAFLDRTNIGQQPVLPLQLQACKEDPQTFQGCLANLGGLSIQATPGSRA